MDLLFFAATEVIVVRHKNSQLVLRILKWRPGPTDAAIAYISVPAELTDEPDRR